MQEIHGLHETQQRRHSIKNWLSIFSRHWTPRGPHQKGPKPFKLHRHIFIDRSDAIVTDAAFSDMCDQQLNFWKCKLKSVFLKVAVHRTLHVIEFQKCQVTRGRRCLTHSHGTRWDDSSRLRLQRCDCKGCGKVKKQRQSCKDKTKQ